MLIKINRPINKIAALKEVRKLTGCGLETAKHLIDKGTFFEVPDNSDLKELKNYAVIERKSMKISKLFHEIEKLSWSEIVAVVTATIVVFLLFYSITSFIISLCS